MEVLLDGLDKQLQAGSITIPAACHRLTAQLLNATTDDIKSLHLLLPRVLSLLLHSADPSHPSWPHRFARLSTDFDALYQLLSPNGVLFGVLLKHSVKAIYDVPEEQLPASVRKSMKNGGLSGVFRERIISVGSGQVMRLDMSEYFLFYLLHVVFLAREPPLEATSANWIIGRVFGDPPKRTLPINDVITLSSSGTLPCLFESQEHAEMYLVLLDQFFKFLLPLSNAVQQSILTVKHLAIHHTAALKLSEFFLQLAMEYYLGAGHETTGTADLNLDQVLALQRLAEHFTLATFVPSTNYSLQGLLEAALPGYKTLIYRRLRSMLQSWPLDNTLSLFLELWMTAAFPWRIIDGQYFVLSPDSYQQLVLQDFYIYYILFDDILEIFCSVFESWNELDGAAVDCEALVTQGGPLVAALLDVFLNLERLVPYLRSLEVEVVASLSSFPLQKDSSNARRLRDQWQQREHGNAQPPLLFTGESSQNRAAFLAGLFERCKERFNGSANSIQLVAWIDQLVLKLKDLFKFSQPIIIADTKSTSQYRPQSNARGRSLSSYTDPVNRLSFLKAAKPSPLANTQLQQQQMTRVDKDVTFLLKIFDYLSLKLDGWFHGHVDRYAYVSGACARLHVNLRPLAKPRNLLIALAFTLLILYLSYRLACLVITVLLFPIFGLYSYFCRGN